jgi:hypothetical protein
MVLFSVGRFGSLEFCFRILFHSSILFWMFRGSGMSWEFILPLGMWCLSAFRMAFIRVVLAVCGLFGRMLLERMFPIVSEVWPVGFQVVCVGYSVSSIVEFYFGIVCDDDWEMVGGK